MKKAPYLTSLSAAGGEFPLNRGEISIGSDPANDVSIAENTVSRRHAKLIRYGGSYRLIDLNSTNGTFVNGKRLDAPTAVNDGDELRFGAARFSLSDPRAAASRAVDRGQGQPRRWGPRLPTMAAIAAFLLAGFAIGEYLLNWDQIEQKAGAIPRSRHLVSDSSNPAPVPSGTKVGRDMGAPNPSPATISTPAVLHASLAEIAAAKAWLDPLNHYRAMAGLGPVEPDPVLSAADAAHARYLVDNFANRIKADTLGIEAHTEDPAKPGYSPDGAKAAAASDVEEGYNPHSNRWLTPAGAITGWISLPFHRLWILNPNLLRAGYGQYCNAGTCVGALDVGTDVIRVHEDAAPYPKPIKFPPDGTTLPIRSAEGEWPDPLTACPGYSSPMGLPITLQLGYNVDPKLAAYSLTNDADGSTVEVCGFDASSYTNPDPSQQARVRGVLGMLGTVVVIPRPPLDAGAYTVSIAADGREYKWSFMVSPSS